MVLTLSNLAERYKCLPSEALSRATTFDLYVLDVSTQWQIHRDDIANGRTVDHNLTQAQMADMIKTVRSE